MGTGRILKRAVEAIPLPPVGSRAYLWDDQLKGFGLMVTPAGARSYIVQYRMGGRGTKTERYTIGRHGSPWTADGARERARDLLQMVREGTNPLLADRAKLAAAAESKDDAARFAFGDYADLFLRLHVDKKELRTAHDIRAVFRRDLKPHFGRKSIKAIRRTDAQACIDKVVERSPSAANKAHKWLRKMLKWAVGRGDLSASPVEGMEPPHQERKRDRVLKGSEIVVVWKAAGDLEEPWRSYYRTLLLLGQRLRETAGMRWDEVDLAGAVWIIPGTRKDAPKMYEGTKNKRTHLVPLPPAAVAILEALQPVPANRKGWVFSTTGKGPLSGFPKKKLELDALVAAIGPLKPWMNHDLRRSVATGCQALGFPKEHVHATINHVSGGKRDALSAIYLLHEYQPEKTAVLNAWARHIENLLSGSDEGKVVPLALARA